MKSKSVEGETVANRRKINKAKCVQARRVLFECVVVIAGESVCTF